MKTMNKKAVSVIEYIVLVIIIIGAFLVLRNYMQRGLYGKWAQTGQSFAFGRQFDPQKTIECAFDDQLGVWYDRNCYEFHKNTHCADGSACGSGGINECSDHTRCGCGGNITCQDHIKTGPACASSYCTQLPAP